MSVKYVVLFNRKAMLEKKLNGHDVSLLDHFLYNYLKQIEDKKNDIILSFSALPSGNILSMLWKLGINLKLLSGKNIMSVGEGVPFLAGSLSKMGANVIAVDPLYEKGPGYIYDSLKCLLTENEERFKTLLSDIEATNVYSIKQLKRMTGIINQGKEVFHNNFFKNDIQFNTSFADNIYGVANCTQDYIILSFLLNNLVDEEEIGFILGEVLNKLKKGGSVVIIGPSGITKSYTTKYHIEDLKKKYKNYKTYNYTNNGDKYIALSFMK